MTRFLLAVLVLLVAGSAYGAPAIPTYPSANPSVRIVDGVNPGARARVTHANELVVNCTTGCSASTSTFDSVNVFHQSTIRHVSSVTHVRGTMFLGDKSDPNRTARITHANEVMVNCANCGASSSDAVNVFHQSTVRHISSVVHIAVALKPGSNHLLAEIQGPGGGGALTVSAGQSGVFTVQAAHLAGVPSISQGVQWSVLAHAQQSGAWTVQAAHLAGVPSVSQGTQWSVLAHAQQSGSWTVQAAHQGGEWNVRHISSQVHIGGFVGIRDGLSGATWARVTHANELVVNCTTGCGASSFDSVNVFHQSTVRHISSVTHVAGQVMLVDKRNPGAVAGIDHQNALLVNCLTGCAGGSSDAVNVFHQSTIRHVSSVIHVGGFIGIRDGLNQTGWARVNHAGQLITNCETGCGAGSSDAVNVFHQSTLRHVSSVTHVGGGIMLRDPLCPTCNARVTHAGATLAVLANVAGTAVTVTSTSLDVNCTGGCGTPTQAQTYIASAISQAAAASGDYLTLFNASGSGKVIKLVGIYLSMGNTVAVTGASAIFNVSRVSTAGTTCTAKTIQPVDSNNAAVPAQVTANTACTTDPTVVFDYTTCSVDLEETRPTGLRPISCYEFPNNGGQPWTLREGQGIMLKTTAVVPVGLATVTIEFTM